MANPSLGKLIRLDPRSVWSSEPRDFTPWLAENLPLLNEVLGLEIELVQREMPVGRFSLDIFGKEASSGSEVVIENQLTPTDHVHLGQLLTYAAGLDAKIVVWISPQFCDEHKQVLDWLNRDTTGSLSFFGVELQLFTIGDSMPAPNFKVVAEPSQWQDEITSEATQRRTPLETAYHNFFTELVARIHERLPGFTNVRRVAYRGYIAFATGRGGFTFSVGFTDRKTLKVELEISTPSYDRNRTAFSKLKDERLALEAELGDLEWDFKEGRLAQRICLHRTGLVDSPDDVLENLRDWAVEQLKKFKAVFGPRIKVLVLDEIAPDVEMIAGGSDRPFPKPDLE